MAHILKGNFGEGKEHLPHLQSYRDEEDKATEVALGIFGSDVVGTEKGPSWGWKTKHGFFMAPTVDCPKQIHNQKPQFAKPVFACDHCVEQDPVHPNGIVLMDRGFYVCQRCFNAIEARRGWKYWEDLKVTCHHCVKDEVNRITKINPELFLDLMAMKITELEVRGKPKLF
jgi:hypothetical protein